MSFVKLTGKERLFMEVARVLHKKVYVGAAKLRLLECLEYPEEDMQWLTLKEHESHIHVVPMWTLASFKRLKHIANQYVVRLQGPYMCFQWILLPKVIIEK
jgi:DNA cross-link repair 1A protein